MKYIFIAFFLVLVILFPVFFLQTQDLISESSIPTNSLSLWTDCCLHFDCLEGEVGLIERGKSFSKIAIEDSIIVMDTHRIYPSINGKSYYCRHDVEEPPSYSNIRCVFLAVPTS